MKSEKEFDAKLIEDLDDLFLKLPAFGHSPEADNVRSETIAVIKRWSPAERER